MSEQQTLFDTETAEPVDPLNKLDIFQMYVLTQLIPFGDRKTIRAEFDFHKSRDNWPEVDSRTWNEVLDAISFLHHLGHVKVMEDVLRRIPDGNE